jgi:hypothetical protein
MEQTGRDPLEQMADMLHQAWGHAEEERVVHWTIYLRAGRVP